MFEWDDGKSERNRRERGFGFDVAARIFAGDILEREDKRHQYGERRILAIGAEEGQIYAVVYTWRDRRRRIISARPANRKERDAYYKAFPVGDTRK